MVKQHNQNLLIVAIVGVVAIVALMVFSGQNTGKAYELGTTLSTESFNERCTQAGGVITNDLDGTKCCHRQGGEGQMLRTCTRGGDTWTTKY